MCGVLLMDNVYGNGVIIIDNDKRKQSAFLQNDSYLAHVVLKNRTTQSVSEHLLGTMELAEKNCPLEILKNIVISEALLHDAGKLSEEFFEYMDDIRKNGKAARRRTIDHTSAGGRILESIIGVKMLSEFISTVIYSHHGLQDNIDMESGVTLFEKRREREIEFETIQQRYFEIIDKNLLIKYLVAAHLDLMKILRHIDDFVRSTGKRDCGSRDFYLGMYERLALSVLIDSDWTDTACFCQGEPHPDRITEERMQEIWWESIANFEDYMNCLTDSGEKSPLNEYRNKISDICFQAAKEERNLYRLTVPTGAGKTFSGLRFALHHAQKYHKKHIIYVAPYNSILEQNAEDIRKAVGNGDFVLEHHCNIFYEDENREMVYKKLTESWDVPIIVTTAVQMLNTLFSGQKSSIRRMHNLCNSVIIFDEVQAFPIRGTELFNLAVNFLTVFCNTTVILCSATQPSLASLKENNLFDCIDMVGPSGRYVDAFKRVEIEDKTDLVHGGMQPEDISEFALESFQEYGSVLIIVNTTKCAKMVYEELKRSCSEECDLYHLSARMCPKNRKDELEAIKQNLKDKKPVICVSTQLIEAGVNLSFGCVIRSLAGLDSIVQAAGRCNRHKEMEIGKVYIIKMAQDAERLDRLYDIRRAQEAAEKVLYYFKQDPEDYEGSIDSERSVTAYYKEYFHDLGVAPTKYPSRSCETTLEELLGRNEPGRSQFKRRHGSREGEPRICQAFATAGKEYKVIDEEAEMTVVIPYDDVAEKAIYILEDRFASLFDQKKAVQTLQQYSVGLSEYLFKKLGRAIHKIDDMAINVLNIDYYDRKEGLLEEPRNRFLNF
ncbi:CRISPR-associated helicase Cas3' [Sellimonas caecigallum]|uniref:CRISPR-associated helicase Cas3 n=1 Tax=Sellimonas caecigallum TaxID=2592333 RepID=A0ABS7L3X3_9FIRM|nr:CRISPR-associated helicase Cas3' [Sellimonas caecigallum]